MFLIKTGFETKTVVRTGICKVRGKEVFRMNDPLPVIMVPQRQKTAVWVSLLDEMPPTPKLAFEFRPIRGCYFKSSSEVFTSDRCEFVPPKIAFGFGIRVNDEPGFEAATDHRGYIRVLIRNVRTSTTETYEQDYVCDEWEKIGRELSV